MFAVVKTRKEVDDLNNYITEYYISKVENADIIKWSAVFTNGNEYAIDIKPSWKDYPVPEFIYNGIVFVDQLSEEWTENIE